MRSKTLKSVLDSVPGKRRLGVYRFLPFFFLLGAGLEFSMINWKVGNESQNEHVNFYKTYKRSRAEEAARFIYDAKVAAGITPTSSS